MFLLMLNLPTSMITPSAHEVGLDFLIEAKAKTKPLLQCAKHPPRIRELAQFAQLPSKMAIASATDAPSQMMA